MTIGAFFEPNIDGAGADSRIYGPGIVGGSRVADTSFLCGFAYEDTDGGSNFSGLSAPPTITTLAVNDFIEVVFELYLNSFGPGGTGSYICPIAFDLLGAGLSAPYSFIEIAWQTPFTLSQTRISIKGGGGAQQSSANFAWPNLYGQYKHRFTRTGATSCKAEVWQWNGASWTSLASITDANYTNSSWATGGAYGGIFISLAKGGSATTRIGTSVIAYNETPSRTGRVFYMLPAADGDLQEWTPSVSNMQHYHHVDDPLGTLPGGRELSVPASSGTAYEERLRYNPFIPVATSIYGVELGQQSGSVSSSANGDLFHSLRVSGSNTAELDDRFYTAGSLGPGHIFPWDRDPAAAVWTVENVNLIQSRHRRPSASARGVTIAGTSLGVFYEPTAAATSLVIPSGGQLGAALRPLLVR